tara:strand:- start:1310 stop:1528 length:219 start_codon:yes stop_codon:yes gene_type:complete
MIIFFLGLAQFFQEFRQLTIYLILYLKGLLKKPGLIILINIASTQKVILIAVLTYDSIFYIMAIWIGKYPDT